MFSLWSFVEIFIPTHSLRHINQPSIVKSCPKLPHCEINPSKDWIFASMGVCWMIFEFWKLSKIWIIFQKILIIFHIYHQLWILNEVLWTRNLFCIYIFYSLPNRKFRLIGFFWPLCNVTFISFYKLEFFGCYIEKC